MNLIIPSDRLFVKGVIAASAPKGDQVKLGGRADPQRNAAGSDPVGDQYGHVFDPIQAAYELLFPSRPLHSMPKTENGFRSKRFHWPPCVWPASIRSGRRAQQERCV